MATATKPKPRRGKQNNGSTATREPPNGDQSLNDQVGKAFEDAGILDTKVHDFRETEAAADAEQAANIDAAVSAATEKQRKAEAFDKIAELNKEVDHAFTEARKAADKAKEKKKAWEALVAKLQCMIADAADPPPMPLFDAQAGTNGEYHPTDDSWRAETLADALEGVSEGLIAKLHAANLHTVGELADYTAEDGGRKRITDITGVGPAAAEKIDAALEAFWKRRKDAEATSKAEPAANDVDGPDGEE